MKITENYRELNDQLEAMLSELQSPDVDIDRALVLYEKGQQLVKKLGDYLAAAENTITKLNAVSTKKSKKKP